MSNVIKQLNNLKLIKDAIRDAINARGLKLDAGQPFEDYSQEIIDMLIGADEAIFAELKRKSGILIPLYIYPTFDGTTGLLDGAYGNLVSLARENPSASIYCIMNPNSGPGVSEDVSYTNAIKQLKSAGIFILGYISTAYPYNGDTDTVSRTIVDVNNDIDAWRSLYPDVGGLFFDEMTYLSSGATYKSDFQNYYVSIKNYAYQNDFNIVIANTGTAVEEWYFTEEKLADNIIIYENSSYPTEDSLKNFSYNFNVERYKKGVLVYGSGLSFVQETFDMITKYVGLVYIADGDDGIWGTVPASISDQIISVASAGGGSGEAGSIPLEKPAQTVDGNIWIE